ncbi:MAG: N-6 DNA methylase [Planctomycetes bacterium]|jgi:hypothetical protein|nr:N-6 DNA methylase [Planctomycetota bacterium]
MNEWEFTALAAGWINAAIQSNRDLPFTECRCEERSKGSLKRRDLTLHGAGGKIAVTGEVKMPYQAEGGSPLRSNVVRDARSKAERAKASHFFTWNVNRCALFPTKIGKNDPPNVAYREWQIIDIHNAKQMQLAANQERIQRWIPLFLHQLAEVLRGERQIERKPPDLRFIDTIEAELEQPILQTADALSQLTKRSKFRLELRRWMVEDQGWTLADDDDQQGVLTDLNRASQFANYALLNKIVFYEALIKRYGTALEPLEVPDHIAEADRLRTHFEGHFARARSITGDYETVFGEDASNVGNRIPFHTDAAVEYWRQLIGQVHEFDFSRLDYDVIGTIFERLISPEERHKYGQYYTRAEVVDLINAFTIRTGKETVMDPACGGGTFLVRAYTRKRELNPAQTHAERLRDLFGTDISHFATHLTTINLATRDLIDDANYPQVSRSDFFSVEPGSVLMQLPSRIVTDGLGTGQTRQVDIPMLDAIVGNPPYVRQEGIPKSPKSKKEPQPGTKEFYKFVAERGYGIDLSGRSDLHVYFWLHAAQFLHHGGRLGLLTSSQWLDVEYGFRLQEFILRNFVIEAIFESRDEPWFVGARVATVATLLRRVPTRREDLRMNNLVRFVQLRRPIGEVMEHDGTAAGAVAAANEFRDHILSLDQDVVTDRYRCRVVPQGELWNTGVRLGKLLGKSKHGPAKEPDRQAGDYYGGKWGTHLRAPDVWFELMDRFGDRFAPLGDIAEIKRGITSGKDAFFFPIDVSDAALKDITDAKQFQQEFGVDRAEVESGRVKIVKCGEGRGELRPLETELLEPMLHNLKDMYGFEVPKNGMAKMILLTGRPTNELPPHGQRYIAWGEENDWHKGSTNESRGSSGREWHDLTGHRRGHLFWSMRHGYRHLAPINSNNLQCNKAFFDVTPEDVDTDVLAGILNSTLVVQSKNIFGRPVGVEGYWATEVSDAKMMRVPDPRKSKATERKRVADAFGEMKKRKALAFVSERRLRRDAFTRKGKEAELADLSDKTELDMPDRWRLDDAVLRMIGVDDKAERQKLLDKLYDHVREHFEWTRQKEERAVENKKRAKKKGPAGPSALAAEIVEQLKRDQPGLLRSWARHFLGRGEHFVTYEVPNEGQPELLNDLIHPNTVRFLRGSRRVADVATDKPEHAELLVTLANAGVRGFVRIPLEARRAEELHQRFRAWWEERQAVVEQLVTQRTGDEDLRERTLAAIHPLLPAA